MLMHIGLLAGNTAPQEATTAPESNFGLFMMKCNTKTIEKFMKKHNITTINKIGYVDGEHYFVEKHNLTLADPRVDKNSIWTITAEDLFYTEKDTYWFIEYLDNRFLKLIEKKFIKYIEAAEPFKKEYLNKELQFIPLQGKENLYVIKYLTKKHFQYEILEQGTDTCAMYTVLPSYKDEFIKYQKMATDFFRDNLAKLNIPRQCLATRIDVDMEDIDTIIKEDGEYVQEDVNALQHDIVSCTTNIREFENSFLLELCMTLGGVRLYFDDKTNMVKIFTDIKNSPVLTKKCRGHREIKTEHFYSVETLKMFLIYNDLDLASFERNDEWWEA